ncbi:MAG: hypothetical protein J6J31_11225 [Thermoguttaceae bacterium]|nr:hypothetical protein [Thermoguttaceae bacterium]
MKTILTAGLTPSWQHVLEFDSLRIDAVNRAVDSLWFSAGKSVNAALAIHTLGGKVRALFPGGGENARKMREELTQMGLETRILPTDAELRICTTLVDRCAQTITELVENGEPLTETELEAWRRLFTQEVQNADLVVISGSLPQKTPAGLYEEMVSQIPAGVPSILDFRGEGLLACLKYRPLAVKPNREELEQTVGRPLSDEHELLDACRMLNAAGAQWVVVSDGPKALWAVSAEESIRLEPPKVTPTPEHPVLCPIGCGDALTGALALAISRGETMRSALSFAMDAAAQNLLQLTSCRFG